MLERISQGRCPIHDVGMRQAGPFFEKEGGALDGAIVAVLVCPRTGCPVTLAAAGRNGPFELSHRHRHLLEGE